MKQQFHIKFILNRSETITTATAIPYSINRGAVGPGTGRPLTKINDNRRTNPHLPPPRSMCSNLTTILRNAYK